jgi:hypothetical protein
MISDVQDSVVQVSADGTTWATISDITTWDADHGTEGITRRRVFGAAQPHVRLGEDTDTYEISGLLNLADTNGQNALRSARDNRTTIFLRVLPEGALGYSQECYVTAYGDSGDADGGDYVECSFSLEGAGAKTPVTIPAP